MRKWRKYGPDRRKTLPRSRSQTENDDRRVIIQGHSESQAKRGIFMQRRNYGKIRTAVIYGDSISTRNHGAGGYEELLKEEMGIQTIYNHAISSSGLCTETPDNLVDLLEKEGRVHPEADLIIIWHGTNDWYWGADVGRKETKNTSTFLGALCHIVKILEKSCPTANLVWLTPIYRCEAPNGLEVAGEAYVTPNLVGKTQKDFTDALIEASGELCFPVIDMRRLANINAANAQVYLEDGVHPNRQGYLRINDILCTGLDLMAF